MNATLLILALATAPVQTPTPAVKETKPETPALPLNLLKPRAIGPAVTSGRVVGIAQHPTDKATYFVAVASGGVWKTTNHGTTWTPVFDGEGSYSIGCVVIDPKNPNTVWVGTGENNSQRSVAYGDGVYKSIDGGRSWTNVGLKASEHIAKIHIDPRDSDTVYVASQGPLWGPGGDRGLYKTTDGGKTWNKILNIDEHTGITDFAQDPKNPDIMLAASYQRRRHVWTLINGGPGSGIHRSTDGGKSWKKIGGGLPGGELGRIGLAMAPTDSDTVYATVEAGDGAGGIFRSLDKGITWEKRNPFDVGAMYYGHVVVDPTNKDRIFVMNVFIQVSDDGGATLRPLSQRNMHVDNHCIYIDPANPNYYRVGCDGGVYESFDKGGSWHFKSNLPVTQFYDINVDQHPSQGPFYQVFGGTQDNYTLGGPVRTRSANGIPNSDWYVVQGGDGFHCAVDPVEPRFVYAESQYGGLVRFDRVTSNRVDIRPLPAPGEAPYRWNWDSPLVTSAHKPGRIYFAGNKLFASDDRGDNWKAISPDLTRQINRDSLPVMGKIWGPDAIAKHQSTSLFGNIVALAESSKKPGLLYVGTDDGLIQVTEDDGKTWRKTESVSGVPAGTYVSKLVASRHNEGVVYAAFDAHKNSDFKPYLMKSNDAGKTWNTIAGDLPERGTVYCLAEDHVNPNLLFCGTEFACYVTLDGGKKWAKLRGLPTIQVKDLVIQRANDDLVIGTFGRGIYVVDDIAPFRAASIAPADKLPALLPVKPALLYVPKDPLGGSGKAFQGASYYAADNPGPAANFTYYIKEVPKTLKQIRKEAERLAEKDGKPTPYPSGELLRAEAEEEAPSVQLLVKDFDDNVLQTINAPAVAGWNKASWDLRANTGGGLRIVVAPGRYRVNVTLKFKGVTTNVAPPTEFTVFADPLLPWKREDYVAMESFQRKLRTLMTTLAATEGTAGEVTAKLEAMKKALADATKTDEATAKRIEANIEMLRVLSRKLRGDRVLAARNENVPVSIAQRVRYAAEFNGDGIAMPTGTQQQALTDATKELAEVAGVLKELKAKELAELDTKLDELGAPWTPGRLPK